VFLAYLMVVGPSGLKGAGVREEVTMATREDARAARDAKLDALCRCRVNPDPVVPIEY